MLKPQGRHDNLTYLKGIKEGDTAVLEDVYQEFRPGIIRYICSAGGSEEEAKDIFAIALEVIFVKVSQDDLSLNSPFAAYLFKVCKYQWLKLVRSKKRREEVTETLKMVYSDEVLVPDEELERQLLQHFVREVFARLGDDCQQIIQMRWEGISYAEIRLKMGHKSEGYSRKRKHICYERLIQLIKEDPRIREWFEP